MNQLIYDVTAETFNEQVIERSKTTPILLDFWADWCEPCKNLTPILHTVVEAAQGKLCLAKVNTDSEQAMAMQMGIQSLPTVALIVDGQIVDSFSGVKSASEVKQWLDSHLDLTPEPAAPAEPSAELQAMIDSGNYQSALEQLQQLPIAQSGWQIIDLQLLLGDLAAAEKTLAELPEDMQNSPQADQAKAKIQLQQLDFEEPELLTLKQNIIASELPESVEKMLQMLSSNVHKDEVKQLLIVALQLIDDPKIAAAYRRRMSRLLF